MGNTFKDMDVESVARAIEADAREALPELREALSELKKGKHGRVHTPEEILIRSTRRKLGLSQEEFAERIGAPLATLRGWEQGRFQPSGVVIRLMQLLSKYPELIHDTDSETQTAIQLDKDVLIALRRVMGNGWQTQVNDVMREWVKQQSGR